ncbi:polysaccharide biosynthesis C-terminal domain-containing protein [Tsuneonella sp. HG094]
MRVLVTGANGFVGRNLIVRMEELGHDILRYGRDTGPEQLPALVGQADAVVHLAGENRPTDPGAFDAVNRGLCEVLAQAVRNAEPSPPVFLASSIQAGSDSAYGLSKRAGEQAFEALPSHAAIVRFPNIFGKWCRPNYNSAVATFAHNAARGLDLPVNDPAAPLRLIYIDDVVAMIAEWLDGPYPAGAHRIEPAPVYDTTVGEVADRMRFYAEVPGSLTVDNVGTGLNRALYATFVSYLPPERFSYPLTVHADPRGRFAEMLRTTGSGQVSFFTAGEGVTRGGHYHHTKTEKFLVVQGRARFRFRHLLTGEEHAFETSADEPRVVDTIPGWSHDIANVGPGEMIVVLWANEAFDREKPDTVAYSLEPTE